AFDTESDLDNMKNYLKSYGNKSPKYNYITRNMMKNSFTLSFSKKKIMFSLETSYVIRLKIPSNVFIKFKDLIKGFINVNSSNLDDKVLIKSTGIPTYHIANVIDDYLMNVTHVMRGDE
ncbi:MAG: glutamate--tRNA ligase family protein, partial [Cytophagales bacterium]